MFSRWACAGMIFFWGLLPSDGWACSIAFPGFFETDPSSTDTVAPLISDDDFTYTISRGIGPTCHSDGSYSYTSCDDLGQLNLYFEAAVDPGSPEQKDRDTLDIQHGLGYILRVIDGTAPDNFAFSETPYNVFYSEGRVFIFLPWVDEASDIQEPFDFTMGVQSIDLAGNLSEEIEIHVSDPGTDADVSSCVERWEDDSTSDTPGCTHRSSPPDPILITLILIILIGFRRA